KNQYVNNIKPPNFDNFLCPVTLETFEDPIISLTTGITYDEKCLYDYFRKAGVIEPISREKVEKNK
ncbi:hypothetical protein MXB_4092, partial [Myxobolus squamalis]